MSCRRPRTCQERKLTGKRLVLHIDGYDIPIRASRNLSNLPTNYDDLLRSDYNHRTWKRHRSTQYYPKPI